jgi:type IV pilus assembly protein PilQ
MDSSRLPQPQSDLMIRILLLAALAVALASAPAGAQASACLANGPRCITVSFQAAPMREVAATFAEFSGHSVILGGGVGGEVTAEVRNQPWDVAFGAILQAHGLAARQIAPGMLRVEPAGRVAAETEQAPLVTRIFRLNYVPAEDVAKIMAAVISPRGRIAVGEETNTLLVTDTEEVIATMARLIGHPPL